MRIDKGGLSSDCIIDDEKSHANLVLTYLEIYILGLFLNEVKKKMELNEIY